MSAPVISARNIGKQYHLGRERTHNTLRDQIAHGARKVGRILNPRRWGVKEETENPDFWALKDVSFDINEGEVVGVIGRNGAGKSTLLKILSKITEPTEGEIRIRGRVASLLEVGTGFHYELTGRENVFLNGAILGMTKSEIVRKFDEIVAFSEVEGFLDTPVKHYSSGMFVRLAFAVAAHLEPDILLVDEVLAVGDVSFQQKCLGKMDEAAKAGRTVLFVSHNMAAVTSLCNAGIYLEKGRIKAAGPINNIMARYLADSDADIRQNVFRREDYKGDGCVRIVDCEVLSCGKPSSVVTGGKLGVVVTYEAARDGLPLQFLVGVYDSYNTRILALDSQVTDDLPVSFPAKGKVMLELPDSFSLCSGRYHLNLAACFQRDMGDFVPNAISFTVEEGNFYGTGRMPYGTGVILCKVKWCLQA